MLLLIVYCLIEYDYKDNTIRIRAKCKYLYNKPDNKQVLNWHQGLRENIKQDLRSTDADIFVLHLYKTLWLVGGVY